MEHSTGNNVCKSYVRSNVRRTGFKRPYTYPSYLLVLRQLLGELSRLRLVLLLTSSSGLKSWTVLEDSRDHPRTFMFITESSSFRTISGFEINNTKARS